MNFFVASLLFIGTVYCDMYLHNPRGSNNRYFRTDDGANVQNNARIFNSQNNNKGGYDWGPGMYFYEGSTLRLEWTAQHGCGPDSFGNTHCQNVLQYMCGPLVRDGTTNTRITQNEAAETNMQFGMHEGYEYYLACTERNRNTFLFTADRTINGRTAQYTRQNENGNERGFECQEERDYYPYWHPSPWRDIAILTSDISLCPMYKAESQNVKNKSYCKKPFYQHNNEQDCPTGEWVSADDAETANDNKHNIAAPECIPAQFSRDNHLGNSDDGYMSHYDWTIPTINDPNTNCVFRIRYNMSTSDYDGWQTDSQFNDIIGVGSESKSPVTQDPYIEWNWKDQYLSLALNTNQYGRTFQDRSHTFQIKPRPIAPQCNEIHNLNVRGKRGNIVQAYPALQYDFTPNNLKVKVGDCIHIQWTGGDNNPAGNEGQGTIRTDRHNMCQIEKLTDNFCMDVDKQTFFPDQATAIKFVHLNQNPATCQTLQSLITEHDPTGNNLDLTALNQDQGNCMKLNSLTDGYFDGGLYLATTPGTYNFMSPRNNNFGWQTQKGTIEISMP